MRVWRVVAIAPLVALLALVACGRAGGAATVDGYLRAGDADFWLVDGTPVAIGGARITGEPSQIGSRIHAQGRWAADGTLVAETITVGKAEPGGSASSLTAAEVSGPIEAQEPASGRWRVQGKAVVVPAGVAMPGGLGVGTQVSVRGYTLPNGDLLAAEIVAAAQAPASTPTRPPPPAAPAQAPTATPVPARSAAPTAAPSANPVPNQPRPAPPAKPPKDNGDGEDKDKGKH